jgi:hypothetical protein
MKKFLIMSAAALTMAATAAEAQHRHRYHHHPAPRHHHGNGHWIAPLVGGLIIGGVTAGIIANSHSGCPYGTRPRYQDLYDQWGRYLGNRRVCVGY